MNKNEPDERWFEASAEQLLTLIRKQNYVANHIILTGGEPCMFDLTAVSSLFIDNGFSVSIETSGTFEIVTHPDTWVTLSPKVKMKGGFAVLDSALARANEIKHPLPLKHISMIKTVIGQGATC